MAYVATRSFRTVETTLQNAPAAAIKMMSNLGGKEEARVLLRHQVAEQNRQLFAAWEKGQILIGLALVGLLVFGMPNRWLPWMLSVLMLAMVIFTKYALTPEITFLGRSLDFMPANQALDQRGKFAALHQMYGAIEVVKLLVGCILAVYLFVFRIRRRRDRRDADEDSIEREIISLNRYPKRERPSAGLGPLPDPAQNP